MGDTSREQTPVSRHALAGVEIAITGRLASMRRLEAIEAIGEVGAHFVERITERTRLLVVGADGWPLQRNGRPTRLLRAARDALRRGAEIEIIGENEFVLRLGERERAAEFERLFPSARVAELLGISLSELRRWVGEGWLAPVKTVGRLAWFDFREIARAKSLRDLIQGGVPATRLRRGLALLERWLPESAHILPRLARNDERGSSLLLRLDDGRLVEPSGQQHFDFAAVETESAEPEAEGDEVEPGDGGGLAPLLRIGDRQEVDAESADVCFERALRAERDGRYGVARELYEQALELAGPEPEIVFNLGNVHYAVGELEPALMRYEQAVGLDPELIVAWNNLGLVLADLGRHDEAVEALRRAVAVSPNYADGHYNLAETFRQMGRFDLASVHQEAWRRAKGDDPSGQ